MAWGSGVLQKLNPSSDAFRFPSGVNEGSHITEGREADIGARASRKDTVQVQVTSELTRGAEAGSAKRQNLLSKLVVQPTGSSSERAVVRGSQFGRVEFRSL